MHLRFLTPDAIFTKIKEFSSFPRLNCPRVLPLVFAPQPYKSPFSVKYQVVKLEQKISLPSGSNKNSEFISEFEIFKKSSESILSPKAS